jgi:hypothetical protein
MAEQNKRIQFLQDALSKLAKSVREVSKGLIDLEGVLSRLTGKTKTFAAEQKKAAASMDKTKKSIKEVSDETKKYEKNAGKATSTSKGFFSTFAKNIKTIASFYAGFLALSLLFKGIQELTVGSVKRFAALESAMARVGAVTGATNEELTALKDNTLEVAGATTFTALEIAGLQTELGKLGFSVEEIQSSTLSIANAAQALGQGLSEVAQKVGVTIRAFNLSASQAANVADTLTAAVNGSALSFESFGTSIGYVAPIAGQLGISFQEVAAAMGVLADSGFQASRIGTGLRKILLEVGESGETLKDTLGRLKDEQLSLNDITEIFGKTAVAQATVLLNNTDKLERYTGAFGALGSATQASAKQVDTLEGKVKLLNSALDAFLTNIGDKATVAGTIFNNLFNFLLPDAVENQLAAYSQLKDNDFFELLSDSAEGAAKNVVVSGKSIEDEAIRITRATLAEKGKLAAGEKEQLLSGRAEIALTEETVKAYNGLLEETKRLIEAKKEDILATEGQERAVAGLTEAGQTLLDAKRNEIINQKQAREANRLAGIEYEDLSTRILSAKDSLQTLSKSSDEYKKTIAEIGKLQTLQTQIAEFQFDEAEIEALVKKLYDRILGAAQRQKLNAQKILENAIFDKNGKLTKGDALSIEIPLSPVIAPDASTEEVFTFLDRLGLESLKSIQSVALMLQKEGVDLAGNIYDEFAEVRLENLEKELDAELELIKNRYQTEEDILNSQLNNQLITESQFRAKQKELLRAQIREENEVERARFDAQKKQDVSNAASDYAQAIAQSFINEVLANTPFPFNVGNALITSSIAGVSSAATIAAINQRKFVPKRFAEGGMVNGPSHSEGGVPFNVQGRGGYEMEGGEFIVNKKASSIHRDLLEKINTSYKVKPISGKRKFAQGGLVSGTVDESVDYLKAIAEATTSTAIQTSKPVRAFVSSSDLRTNETERRLRDRNDKI